MMPDNDQKIELELALKDSMSPILQSVRQMLDNVNRTLQRSGISESNAINKVTQSTHELGEKAKATTGAFENMGVLLVGVGKTLSGAIGIGSIAYGVGEVVKSLEKFAVGSAQLRNFARDTGFTVEQVQHIQLQFRRSGETVVAANQQIEKYGAIFNDVIGKQTSSPFYQELRRYNKDLADQVFSLINEGERWKAIELIRDEYFRAPEGSLYRARLDELLQTQNSVWSILKDNTASATRYWIPATAIADEYLKRLNVWKTRWLNAISEIKTRAILTTITDPEKRKAAFDALRKQEETISRDLWGSNFPEQLPTANKELLDRKDDSKKVTQDIRDILERMLLYPLPTARQEGGPVSPGRSYLVGEKKLELLVNSDGSYRIVGASGPEVIRPTMAGQIKAFAGGGLMGLAEQYGYSAPAWMKKSAEFLQRSDVQYAAGFMHAGLGGASTGMHALDMAIDTATAAPNEWPRIKRLLNMSSADTDTIELSAMQYKSLSRSERVEDVRPWWTTSEESQSLAGLMTKAGWNPGGVGGGGRGYWWDQQRRDWMSANVGETGKDYKAVWDRGVQGDFSTFSGDYSFGPLSYEAGSTDIDVARWRGLLDKSLGDSEAGGSIRLDAEMYFNKVPDGVKISTDYNDDIDNFKMSKTRQLEGAM